MSKINSQKKHVEEQVIKYGVISRNYCLKNYITRLSAIICDMQKKGYLFEVSRPKIMTPWGAGYDYVYTMKVKPSDKIYK
jgi:hypothetical protein